MLITASAVSATRLHIFTWSPLWGDLQPMPGLMHLLEAGLRERTGPSIYQALCFAVTTAN
jgi:hypothetical protein